MLEKKWTGGKILSFFIKLPKEQMYTELLTEVLAELLHIEIQKLAGGGWGWGLAEGGS